jgi:CRP-like cAMP-binding protein
MIGEGNMFGETEILLGVPRFCSVVSDSEVEVGS